MAKKIFITATGTDKGKTYISALLAKKVNQLTNSVGYYKVALSGADDIASSDAGYVKEVAKLSQSDDTMISYLFSEPVSPHLASRMNGVKIDMQKARQDFDAVCSEFDYVIVEGSGGIVCPLRYDDKKIMLADVVKEFNLTVLVVCGSGLGSINESVLTVEYLRNSGVHIAGLVLNEFEYNNILHADNAYMIEQLTGEKIIGIVKKGDTNITINDEDLIKLFK